MVWGHKLDAVSMDFSTTNLNLWLFKTTYADSDVTAHTWMVAKTPDTVHI